MNFDQAHLQPSSRGSSIAICVVCLCLHGCAPVGDTGSTYGAQAWDRLSVPEGTSAELRQLMLSTYSTSAKTRAEAAVKLGEMGEPAASATPFLIRLLCDDELSGLIERATVADLACTALVQLGEPAFESCVAQIRRMPDMEHMSYEAYATGARLIDAIGKFPSQRAADVLTSLLLSDDRCVRSSAASSLMHSHNPNAQQVLVQALTSPDVGLRREIANHFRNHPDRSSVDRLIVLLDDSDPETKRMAVCALGKQQDLRAVPGLVKIISNDNEAVAVRAASATALGELAEPTSLELIRAVLLDQRRPVEMRCGAACGLRLSKQREHAEVLTRVLKNPADDDDVRIAVLQSLVDLLGDDAMSTVGEVGRNKSDKDRVRFWAAIRLSQHTKGAVDDYEAVEVLLNGYVDCGHTMDDSRANQELAEMALQVLAKNGKTFAIWWPACRRAVKTSH